MGASSYRVGAERVLPRRFARGEADTRLEPLPITIDQTSRLLVDLTINLSPISFRRENVRWALVILAVRWDLRFEVS